MAASARTAREAPAHILGPRLLLLLSVLALVLLGLVMIYSTSSVVTLSEAQEVQAVNPMADMLGQLKFALAGIVIAFVIWRFLPCSVWKGNLVWAVWALAFLLLVATAAFGTGEEEWGAKRWLSFGSASLQASEFAKIALVLVAARLFDGLRDGEYPARTFFVLLGLLVVAPVLIILGPQSDLGTAMICVVGILAVMWLGEVPTKYMVIAVVLIVMVGLVGMLGTEYRRARVLVLFDPWNDGADGYGKGYQIIHSLYALASGGLFGVGLGNSHEKYLYLTQSDTDFIFAIIGEELGLVGALAVVALFLVFLYAGMRIARSASDSFAMMVAGGCTIMITFQAFLNIAMVIGWFPVVGKPLPFISSGGSSLVATFIMVGLILSVSREAGAPSVYERRRADLRVVRAEQGRRPRGSSGTRRAESLGAARGRGRAAASARSGLARATARQARR